jgi:hypothetical protein
MDGIDEGLFSWFTVNFLLGKNIHLHLSKNIFIYTAVIKMYLFFRSIEW